MNHSSPLISEFSIKGSVMKFARNEEDVECITWKGWFNQMS